MTLSVCVCVCVRAHGGYVTGGYVTGAISRIIFFHEELWSKQSD